MTRETSAHEAHTAAYADMAEDMRPENPHPVPAHIDAMRAEFPSRYEDDYLNGDESARDGFVSDALGLFGPPLTFTLTITLGNDGMQSGSDVADSLAYVGASIRDGYDTPLSPASMAIRDDNGNTVGSWGVK